MMKDVTSTSSWFFVPPSFNDSQIMKQVIKDSELKIIWDKDTDYDTNWFTALVLTHLRTESLDGVTGEDLFKQLT